MQKVRDTGVFSKNNIEYYPKFTQKVLLSCQQNSTLKRKNKSIKYLWSCFGRIISYYVHVIS